jgi:RimJ/RimL family protein N-acetyltransferase
MPQVRLVPMSQPEFAAFVAHEVKDYAEEHVKAGNWSADEALAKSEAEFKQLLPEGKDSKDNYLYSIFDAGSGVNVGNVWFAVVERGSPRHAFIYDFRILDEFHRQGYGAQAMLAVESEVRKLGLNTISLHVFGHNHAARALYEKVGYEVTNVNMTKHL